MTTQQQYEEACAALEKCFRDQEFLARFNNTIGRQREPLWEALEATDYTLTERFLDVDKE